tara:strand:- start:245 stop:433 length:189 start_codon:yes stop_codon:yes gene_type:complete
MLEKIEILVLLLSLIFIFYVVITFGAKKRKSKVSPEIKRYLFGVRILLIGLAVVAFILWSFL